MGRSRKPVRVQALRGFESHPLRHFSSQVLGKPSFKVVRLVRKPPVIHGGDPHHARRDLRKATSQDRRLLLPTPRSRPSQVHHRHHRDHPLARHPVSVRGETVSQPAGWHSEFSKWLEGASGRRGDGAANAAGGTKNESGPVGRPVVCQSNPPLWQRRCCGSHSASLPIAII